MSPNGRYGIAAAVLVTGLAVIGLLPRGATGGRSASGAPVFADPVFAASFKDFNRQPQPLAQWRGKVTLVYFWATWCVPCQHEVPALIRAYEKYRSRDLVIVGIAIDQTDKVRKFTEDYGINYQVLIGGTDALELAQRMGDRIRGLPFLLVIDRQGRVVATQLGEFPDERLEAMIAPLMGS